jgi:potassium channel subfamily K
MTLFGETVMRSKHGLAMITGDEGRQILVKAEVESRHRALTGILIKCTLMVFGYVLFGYIWFNHSYGWTFTDCFYFAMVTVTTVGYGDLTPADEFWHQLFVGIYAFCGVAVIAAMVSDLALVVIAAARRVIEEAKKQSLAKSAELMAAAKKLGTNMHHDKQPAGKKKVGTLKKLKIWFRWALQRYGRTPVTLALLAFQLCLTWEAGATILQINEGTPHAKAFYCAVITSISVGYGDIYPVTQWGRLCFGFYIPVAVTIVVGSIGKIVNLMHEFDTIQVVRREPLTNMFKSDADGDGCITRAEYVLFMLQEMRECSASTVKALRRQFESMDSDGSGTLEASDFPDTVEVEITTTLVSSNITKVKWVVVPKDSIHGDSERHIEPEAGENRKEGGGGEGAQGEEAQGGEGNVPMAERITGKPLPKEYQIKLDGEVLKVRGEYEERIVGIRRDYEAKLEAARSSQYETNLENATREYQNRLDASIAKMQTEYDSKLEKIAGGNGNGRDYAEQLAVAMKDLRTDYDQKLRHLERRVSVAPVAVHKQESSSGSLEHHLAAQQALVTQQEQYRQHADAWREELHQQLSASKEEIARLERALGEATKSATKVQREAAKQSDQETSKSVQAEAKIRTLQKELDSALVLLDTIADAFDVYVVDDPTGALPEECGE